MKKSILLFSFICLSIHAQNLSWTVPSSWEDTKVSSSMRLTTLAVKANKDLKISVSRFPGNVGGEVANVNRWRRQIGLAAVAANKLVLEEIETKAGKAKLLDISNNGQQMLAGMIAFKGSTYFFKMTGKADDVKKQKKAMIELLKSLK